MENQVVLRAMQRYGLSCQKIMAAQKGYRNHNYPVVTDQGLLNLILYKDEPGIVAQIKRANAVGNFLAHSGVPARSQFDKRLLRLANQATSRYAALYTYLPGETIAWEAYTMERLKALGQAMATMHAVLQRYTQLVLPSIIEQSLELTTEITRYFQDDGVQKALLSKLGLKPPTLRFEALLARCQQLPGNQPLHMDFVRGNILYQGAAVSGIIDFEKAAHGPVLFDLARTLAFLLIDCKYKNELQVRKYFLHSGYSKRGGGTVAAAHLPILNSLVYFYFLHDFYKFLRHNPYEYLPQNEHFVRTRDKLLRGGLITAA